MGSYAKTYIWKARQIEGLHYNKLHAAVAHKDTIRVFLLIVNRFDLECDQVDIVSAFLNGKLEETIYVHPPGLSGIPKGKVLTLKKSLNGLKQSPRCFNKKFHSWLKSVGFTVAKADPCLYIQRKGGNLIILSIHIDDQLIASNNRPALDGFKRQLNNEFECKDFGPANHFLGFDIHRDRPNRKLYISQEQYLQEVLARFDLMDRNLKQLLPSGFCPVAATDEEHTAAKHLPYAQIVGSITPLSSLDLT